MTVEVGIVFSKSTYMKNTIISRTLGDMKEDYLVKFCLIQFWFDKVKDSLNKLRNSSKIANRKS